MLILYFSGTGNTEYIARQIGQKMGAVCHSIEEKECDFAAEINAHDTIAVCYPIYGSRVPYIMRQFVVKHMEAFKGKKLVIFVTQIIFSGDGARALCDLFPDNHVNVIYAEHFFMSNNVCNVFVLRQTSRKKTRRLLQRADKKMTMVCDNLHRGIHKRRGFSTFSRLLGAMQGKLWQGDSRNAFVKKGTAEHKTKNGVKISGDCTACGVCLDCPMDNLRITNGIVETNNNCTGCYRCINCCPQRAISVMIKVRPKWQYARLGGESDKS